MATPLLLVVHGRRGGALPAELLELAARLEHRRAAPVRLQALSADQPPAAAELLRPGLPLTLVPLLLLPGAHVTRDLPAIARHWRRCGGLRRLPFLGAWPGWLAALAAEVASLRTAEAVPSLVHHIVEGPLAARYLAVLARRSGARCLATPYSADHLAHLQLTLSAPALPLALAANRLTDLLAERLGPPLLQRPALRQVLVESLAALP